MRGPGGGTGTSARQLTSFPMPPNAGSGTNGCRTASCGGGALGAHGTREWQPPSSNTVCSSAASYGSRQLSACASRHSGLRCHCTENTAQLDGAHRLLHRVG